MVKATYLGEQTWYKPWLGVLHEASQLSKEKNYAKKSQQGIARLINGCKKRQVRIRLAASRIIISGNHVLRRPKHSKIEVVTPKEEELVMDIWDFIVSNLLVMTAQTSLFITVDPVLCIKYEMIYQLDTIEYLFVFFQLEMFLAYTPIFRSNGGVLQCNTPPTHTLLRTDTLLHQGLHMLRM